jgi:hypothetical protein
MWYDKTLKLMHAVRRKANLVLVDTMMILSHIPIKQKSCLLLILSHCYVEKFLLTTKVYGHKMYKSYTIYQFLWYYNKN